MDFHTEGSREGMPPPWHGRDKVKLRVTRGTMPWEPCKNHPTGSLQRFNSTALLCVLSLGTGEDTVRSSDVLLLVSKWK